MVVLGWVRDNYYNIQPLLSLFSRYQRSFPANTETFLVNHQHLFEKQYRCIHQQIVCSILIQKLQCKFISNPNRIWRSLNMRRYLFVVPCSITSFLPTTLVKAALPFENKQASLVAFYFWDPYKKTSGMIISEISIKLYLLSTNLLIWTSVSSLVRNDHAILTES